MNSRVVCLSLVACLISGLSLPVSAERTLQQSAVADARRASPAASSPPPPGSPSPSPSPSPVSASPSPVAPANSTAPVVAAPTTASNSTANSTTSAVATSTAAATSSAAAAVPTSAVFSQFPFNPSKFNPTVQTTDTGAQGAETQNATAAPRTVSAVTATTSTTAASTSSFVKTSGTGFTLNGARFYAAGSNGYYLGLISNGVQYGFTDAAISSYFSGQAGQNLNAIRVWMFVNGDGERVSTDTTNRAAQITPGVYNETVLRRFDRIVATAGAYNIKLICTLSNYLPELGGAQWYVDYVLGGANPSYGSGGAITQWYTNANVMRAFQNYIGMLLGRTNVYTGRLYKNEPAIMAWEIINEPEYTYNGDTSGATVRNWVNTMANYIRSQDANHLITTGEEGFSTAAPTTNTGTSASTDGSCLPCDQNTAGAASPYPFALYHNFVNAGAKGVDFQGNLALTNINFGTVHAYPQAFGIPFSGLGDYDNYTWINTYFIASRAAFARTANKPIILEEFGTVPQGTQATPGASSYTNNYGAGVVQQPRNLVYGSMLASAAASGYAGAFPWEVYPFAASGSAFSASTITFQWGQDGSGALWAWGNYTACAIRNGPAACTYARPVAEPNLVSGTRVYGYCNKGQSPTSPCLDCDIGFPGSNPATNCTVAAQQAYQCSPGAFYQYVRCQATCNCQATATG